MDKKQQYKFERVMVVDDNEIDIFISAHLIKKSNFAKNIMQYAIPGDALKYLQDNQENIGLLPQIIFLDIHMPMMTGFQFMEYYEKMSSILKHNCKVFIVSSTCDDRDIEKVQKEKNVIAFHEKPITKQFLESL